jgi:DNA-binding protein HU-beta
MVGVGEVMTKQDLIRKMAEEAKITRAQAGEALNAFLDGVREGLEIDGSVTLVGFGTFKVKELGEREGRNPSTGEAISIPSRRVVRFAAGKNLKVSMN